MRLTSNRIAGIMRQEGYKLTPQRHAVLKVIAASSDYLTPEDIYERARLYSPGIGLITIYRTLGLLSDLNLVCRVHAPDGCRGYMMRRPTEHHHHIVCSSCSKVVDFKSCGLSNLERKLHDDTGFDISGHLLEFYGLCPECRLA